MTTAKDILTEGAANPLSDDEQRKLLRLILRTMRRGALKRGDEATMMTVGTDEDIEKTVEKLIKMRHDRENSAAQS